jgi:hypothetical protein
MPRTGSYFLVALSVVLLAGCKKHDRVEFTKWNTTSSQSRSTGSEASAKLVSAGNSVDQRAKVAAKPDSKGKPTAPITTRTTFFPKHKNEARQIIGASKKDALSAAASLDRLVYEPTGLMPPPPYLAGIRLIGNSLIWDIEEAISNHDYDKAIPACGQATQLGFALMSGGAYEASLGASFINQARQKMVPILGNLSGFQLGKLGAVLQKASAKRPPLQVIIENERDNMLLGLQQAQDAFENNKLEGLQDRMGSSSKDTIDMLQSLEKDQEKGKAIFDYIGNDITARAEWYLKLIKSPRNAGLQPKRDEAKSKLMIYRYFGSSLENLVPMLQLTYCRTQLFVLECYLKQKLKMGKDLPDSLAKFSRAATLDPFTGEPFFYKVSGSSYLLYSAGEDGIDNGGTTDPNGRRQDIQLEKAHS